MMTFPEAWPVEPLGDIVEVLDSKRVPVSAKERADRLGDVPYYGATGRVGWIDEALFNEPLVLLGEDGVQFFDPDKPKSYLINGPAWVNNHAHVLRTRPDLDRRFLNYYLNSADYRGLANGTTRLKLTQAAMRRLPVPVPDLEEQCRIVDVLEDHLSRIDAADQGLQASIAKLNRLRERTIVHALTMSDEPERSTAALDAAGTVDGDLPTLPVGWSWARLGDVAEVVGGITKDAKKQADPTFVEVPYLRVANVQRGHLNLDMVTTIRVDPTKAKALTLEQGDVLLNEGGDRDKLARGWVWEGQIDGCIHQNHVFRARIHEPRLDPYFLSWTANTFGGRWAERNGKQSVNLASISLSMIRKMPVIVPPAGVAHDVVNALRDQLQSYERLAASLTDARMRGAALRRSLLAAAFDGLLTSAEGRGEGLESMLSV